MNAVVDEAARRELFVLLSSQWFGYHGCGFRRDVTTDKMPAYGEFLAERFAGIRDLLWLHVGDNNPGDKLEAVRTLARTLKERAPHQLQSAHNAEEYASSTWFNDDAWLDVDFVYTYHAAHVAVYSQFYSNFPTRPMILGETGYERESNTGWLWQARHVRQQPYRAVLSGACGHALGTKGVYNFRPDWKERLDFPATRQMAHLLALFREFPAHELVPDNNLLLEGRSHGSQRAGIAARSGDGRFALAHFPDERSIRLRDEWTHTHWFDPTSGRTRPATLPYPSHPGPNFLGDDDWVLILQR